MNEILFSALFIVCGFNLLKQLNTTTLIEYHILNNIKYTNENGISLKEKTTIHYELPTKHSDKYLDIQEMIYNWNKSLPIVD